VKKILTVARWEYVERVRSRIFMFSLILMPLIMVLMGILPGVLAGRDVEGTRVIGVVDSTGLLLERFSRRMQGAFFDEAGNPLYVLRPIPLSGGNAEPWGKASDRMLRDGEIDGLCLLSGNADGGYSAEYRTRTIAEFQIPGRIREVLRSIVVEDRFSSLGVGPGLLAQVDSLVRIQMVRWTGPGSGELYDEAGFLRTFFSAYVFLTMLFFLIFSSGQLLVRSVMEEKATRVVELLVSSCSSTQLMAGKVLGLSGLGFTQMAVWAVIGAALTLILGLPPISVGAIILLVLYFVLGYLLYAAIFIAVGSPVSTEQEAQHVTSLLVLVLVIPLVLTIPAIQDPDAVWIMILTYIPLLTPTMMAMRVSLEPPAVLEIVLTTLLMVVSIIIAMAAAGRIFRVAILSTGKRPGLREILSWIRTGA
jgi:ABC-2 type transport system permease protein